MKSLSLGLLNCGWIRYPSFSRNADVPFIMLYYLCGFLLKTLSIVQWHASFNLSSSPFPCLESYSIAPKHLSTILSDFIFYSLQSPVSQLGIRYTRPHMWFFTLKKGESSRTIIWRSSRCSSAVGTFKLPCRRRQLSSVSRSSASGSWPVESTN